MAKGKGKKKAVVDVFARLGKFQPVGILNTNEAIETADAEVVDTVLTISPPIPRVEVGIGLQFRCSVPILEGDVIQLSLPGFKAKPTVFTAECLDSQGGLLPTYFQGFWTGDGVRGDKRASQKQTVLLKCVRRIEMDQHVSISIPFALGLVSPDKVALNASKFKIRGDVVHAQDGKILKQVILSTQEVKKRPVIEEINEYKNLMLVMDKAGDLEKDDQFAGEELSVEELDHITESAYARCPYPVGFQWHIAVEVFHEYEECGLLLKTLMEGAISSVKKRDKLSLQREIAKNLGLKVGAVIVFQDVLNMLYGSLYPNFSSPVLLVIRLLTMEPIDIARTFLVDPPQLSVAQEIYSYFRIGDAEGMKKWEYTASVLLLVLHRESPSAPPHTARPPLFYGVKELPQEELRYLRSIPDGDWYMFPCFTMVRPNVNWLDEEAFAVPDSAVLFEIHDVTDAVEICDISMHPYDREWLLPMCSMFRVKSITAYDDRNGLTHVVLSSIGCLHGSVKDAVIPEDDQAVAKVVAKKLRGEMLEVARRSRYVAIHSYLTVRMQDRLRLNPATLVRAQYVDHYFEVKRSSQVKSTIEDGSVNWQVCTNPVQMIDPVEGVIKHAMWESMPRRFALLTEHSFLSRTRHKKTFELNGITLDFVSFTCDYGGKGPRSIRRLVRKRVSHEGPLPVLPELVK
ncbi:hypothetical protein, conserved [Trypanosoma brucei brucei TREU927]|uniref:Uncharacterized protein n=1 Tax=Trypanosoma brucei brucei (strain 927/4 GUTat10.1) TaxID=185431 RepID=Q57ZD7_TRYB2|nr:hypothetical protein, conserved [Trypanosoma brucei brucei TREU927]AAX80259.1 hypothetical protein, conserved [Trypanosoma brucei]AAZ10209.1 hypothetical protein, conserved [Trypanosoma brucei brucei TREU927]